MDLLQKHLNELLETISSFNNQSLNNNTSLASSSSSSAFIATKQTNHVPNTPSITCNSLVNASITNTGLLAATIPSVLSNNTNNNNNNNHYSQNKTPSCTSLYNNNTNNNNKSSSQKSSENLNQIACKLEETLKMLIQVFIKFIYFYYYYYYYYV